MNGDDSSDESDSDSELQAALYSGDPPPPDKSDSNIVPPLSSDDTLRIIEREIRKLRRVPEELETIRQMQTTLLRSLNRLRSQNSHPESSSGGLLSEHESVCGKMSITMENIWIPPPSRRSSNASIPPVVAQRRTSHFLPGAVALAVASVQQREQPPSPRSNTDHEGGSECMSSSRSESGGQGAADRCFTRSESFDGPSRESSAISVPAPRGFRLTSRNGLGIPPLNGERRNSLGIPPLNGERRNSSVRLQLVSEEKELAADSVFSATERAVEEAEPRSPKAALAACRTVDRLSEFSGISGASAGAAPAKKGRFRKMMLKPYSNPRLMWDALVIFAIICSTVLNPLAAMYLSREILFDVDGFVGFFANFADLVWFVNIFVCCITGYFSEGFLVLDPGSVFNRYMRSWMPLDALSVLPLVLGIGHKETLSVLIVLKLTRMLRILPLFSRLQREYRSTAMAPIKVAVTVTILHHLMCCGWRWAQGVWTEDDALLEGRLSWGDHYVKDFYWVLMTMTTVGYGDIAPTTTAARCYAICTMLASPVFFGTILSGLTHVTKEVFTDPVETRVAKATRFMARRGVSHSLQRKVEHNLRQHIQQEHLSSMDPELVSLLSPTVQKELALELLSSTVLKFPLFKSAPYSFISQLATSFEWMLMLSGDVVAEEGQVVFEAMFVMRGRLFVDSSNPSNLNRHRLLQNEEGPLEFPVGAWFGETCLFFPNVTHDFTVTALVDSEMATLQASEYHRIAEKYPRVAEQQKKLQSAIKHGHASMNQLAFKTKGLHSHGSFNTGAGLARSGAKLMRKFSRAASRVEPC